MSNEPDLFKEVSEALEHLSNTVERMQSSLTTAIKRITPNIDKAVRQLHDAAPDDEPADKHVTEIVERWLNSNKATFEARYGANWRSRLEEMARAKYGKKWKKFLAKRPTPSQNGE